MALLGNIKGSQRLSRACRNKLERFKFAHLNSVLTNPREIERSQLVNIVRYLRWRCSLSYLFHEHAIAQAVPVSVSN